MEHRSTWSFQTTPLGWTWEVAHPDGTRASSAQPFKTLKECADDATARGYVAWKAEDERRRDQKLGVVEALKPSPD